VKQLVKQTEVDAQQASADLLLVSCWQCCKFIQEAKAINSVTRLGGGSS